MTDSCVIVDDQDWEEMCGECVEADNGEADPADITMCFFCEEYPICKNQIFGICCAKDYRGAAKDAKDQGKAHLAAFNLMKKKKDQDLKDAVASYRSKCRSYGRGKKRPPFDWAGFAMALKNRSCMDRGSKTVRITMGQWCYTWTIDNFKNWESDKMEAKTAWFAYLETLPAGRICPGKLEIWDKAEDFIVSGNTKEQEETLNYGHKNVKNPSADWFRNQLNQFGKDHQEKNMDHYGKSLGMNEDMLELFASNPMAASSMSKEDEEQDKLAEIAEATEAESKKNKKPKKVKEFDEQGVRTIMDPQVKDRANKLHQRATTLFAECRTLMAEVRKSFFSGVQVCIAHVRRPRGYVGTEPQRLQ